MQVSLIVLIMFVTVLLAPDITFSQQASDDSVLIGPWRVEVVLKGRKFDSCSMSCKSGDIKTTVLRASDGLALVLNSPKWKLERGKQYPVELVAGSRRWPTRASAERDSAIIALTDVPLNEMLRTADVLEIRAEGSTISVSLDRSAAALDRIEACYEKNSRSPETNPFVAPGLRP